MNATKIQSSFEETKLLMCTNVGLCEKKILYKDYKHLV